MTAPALAIVPYRPELAGAFAEINRAWIERFFRMEEADRKVLADPEGAILTPGGQIFFAMEGAVPVGTAAAIRLSPTTFELAKMGVRPSHQGRGVGELLARAVIDYARGAGATRVILETNSSLAPALRLYQRLGFVQRPPPAPSDYSRADVYMELRLRPGA